MVQAEKQEKIMFDVRGGAGIVIEQFDSEGGDTAFRLSWTDYVANTWTEYYPTLSIALLRASLLVACLESTHRDLLFAFDSTTFVRRATNFIEKEVH